MSLRLFLVLALIGILASVSFATSNSEQINLNGVKAHPDESMGSYDVSLGYWNLTITIEGDGSTDQTSQSVPVGSDLNVTALETTIGSEFDHWESNIAAIDESRTNPITVPAQPDLSTHNLTAVFVAASPLPIVFDERPVWIQNAAWPYFPTNKRNVLTNHLGEVVTDLENNNITMAFVFVGYWTVPATLTLEMTDEQITTVINALHAVGIKVLAWGENAGAIDVSPANRDNLYSVIASLMTKGFDGYHDDIEDWTTTLQDWVDYENNCTVLLHGMDKLMTAAVGFDWQQNTNPYLQMDYIVSMFYSSQSKCEDPQGRAYWQENFGEYGGNNNTPASPVIIGLMNYYGNKHSLAWQLNWVSNELNLDPHPQLAGFCIWLYEYMTPSDWSTWKYWTTGTIISEYQSSLVLTFLITATLVALMIKSRRRIFKSPAKHQEGKAWDAYSPVSRC